MACAGRSLNGKVKRSSNRIASWALAIAHSLGGMFHAFAARFNTRNRRFTRPRHRGKMTPGANRPPQLGIQTFKGIRGVNNSPAIIRDGKEGNDFRPVPTPGWNDRRRCLPPDAFGEAFKGGLAGIGVLCR